MWYTKEKLDENKRRRELYRQAVERRLTSGGPTFSPTPKKKSKIVEEPEEVRKRKQTGFLGEM